MAKGKNALDLDALEKGASAFDDNDNGNDKKEQQQEKKEAPKKQTVEKVVKVVEKDNKNDGLEKLIEALETYKGSLGDKKERGTSVLINQDLKEFYKDWASLISNIGLGALVETALLDFIKTHRPAFKILENKKNKSKKTFKDI